MLCPILKACDAGTHLSLTRRKKNIWMKFPCLQSIVDQSICMYKPFTTN